MSVFKDALLELDQAKCTHYWVAAANRYHVAWNADEHTIIKITVQAANRESGLIAAHLRWKRYQTDE